MPTPVSAARQCLTEEAARALDDAVAVARRRSHAQTTSLHAVSALLALPSSTLRDACARARRSAYSPRLQFHALELCVGVSLDRLASSKTVEDPPISNSLMAAIKRSQANQRRHPESYHLQQIHNSQQQTASLLKVELKYFILSILDDPSVSRVFGDAGFRSGDIKVAIVHPPLTQGHRFPRPRCPPIFLCNLTDSDSDPGPGNFTFPFSGPEDVDENCRRIGDSFVKKNGKNPLLVGVCASDALKSFTECVQRGKGGVLPAEITGLSVICIENEVREFVVEGGSEEKMDLKFKELGHIVERCSGPGIIVNFGELKVLIGDVGSGDAVRFVVSKLTSLLESHRGKLWLTGTAGTDDTYSKFLAQFPTIQKDWDLSLLPITVSKPSIEGLSSKSSLMRSFVPFGGFFSTPSEIKNPLSSADQRPTRCHVCTEKYVQEVAALQKGGSNVSVADQYSEKLPSWLQMTELDTSKGVDVAKTRDDRTTLDARILGVRKKWDDICQRVHPQLLPKLDFSQARSQVPTAEGFQFVADRRESRGKVPLNESQRAILNPSIHMDFQKNFPSKHNILIPVASEAENVNFQSKLLVKDSKSRQMEMEGPCFPPYPLPNMSPPPDRTSSSSLASVTTDLGLGTLYASTSQEPNTPKLQEYKEHHQHFAGSISAEFDAISENTSHQIAQSSCSGPTLGEQFNSRDYKAIRKVLAEKVDWQDEAICTISQAVSRFRTGYGKHHPKGHIWLAFLGPDKVGKKKIASALAEIMFGSQESLISVDLSQSQEMVSQSNSIFKCQELNDYDEKFGRKTIVDYVAGELRKKPQSIIYLEHVDKADILIQRSLSQSIRTGKFKDSHGREMSINNVIFVTTSTITKGYTNFPLEKERHKFSEEKILGAKSWQMQILLRCVSEDARRNNGMDMRLKLRIETSNPACVNKRKVIDISDSTEQDIMEMQKQAHKTFKSCLDLNLPVEETEEDGSCGDCQSDSISENSEAWLEHFFGQVDERVVFKPFNFDVLGEKIVKDISLQFERIFGSEILLDIDHEIIVQILAAAWLSDNKRAVEDWVETILSKSFAEARRKYHLTAGSVVKLVACKGLSVEEQAPGVCLPAKIMLN